MGYELQWEPRGAIKRYFGHVTRGDMIAPVIATEADPRFDALRYVINDFLDVQSISFTAADVDEIAAMDTGAALTNPRIKIAVVALRPDILVLVRRYMQVAVAAYPTAVFPTMDEARAWVDQPVDGWPTTVY